MTSRLFGSNFYGSLKKIGTLLFAISLIALLANCTEKSAEEKNLHNTLINEYSDTFLRVQFTDNGELHLEFELEDESSSRDALKQTAREYASFGYTEFGKSEQVNKVTVRFQGAGTGNMSAAAASESFTFAAGQLQQSQ